MQAAADAGRTLRKREGFGTIAGDSAKRYPFLRVEIGWPPLCLPIFSSLSSAGKP